MATEYEPLTLITTGNESFDVPLNGCVDVHRLLAHLQSPGIGACDVQEPDDQPGDPVCVGLDGLQHQPLLVVGEAVPATKKSRRKTLHGRQRRAQLVGNRGDQRGTICLRSAARLGVPQCNDNLADRHTASWAQILGSHQDLTHSGDDQQPLAVTRADGQSVPWISALPPGATVVLLQGNRLTDVLAKQLRGGDSDNPGGPGVDIDDEPLVVGDQQSVWVMVADV